jgi:NAD(P)-dependent dehydrogenase (short-subunit alcohol dehydrogenase family)
MKDFNGAVAVITGGAAGLGKAMAERFAAEGVKLVLADIEKPVLDKTVAEFNARGVPCIGVLGDVSKSETIENLLKTTLDTYGKVNILCNNAGVASGGIMWERSVKDWEWVLGVNLWSVIHGLRLFIPQMLKQGDECHIVNTASMAGLTSNPFMATYNVTKHAVVTLSETVFQELQFAKANIGVSVLCPAWVKTGIAESERNRPTDLTNPGAASAKPDPISVLLEQQVKALIAGGLEPAQIGQAVFDAVKNRTFYILTHEDTIPAVQRRCDEIVNRKNPTSLMEQA